MACSNIAQSCYQQNIPIVLQLARLYKDMTQWPSKDSPNSLGTARNQWLPSVVLIKLYNPRINVEPYSPMAMESRCLPDLHIPWLSFILKFFSPKRTGTESLELILLKKFDFRYYLRYTHLVSYLSKLCISFFLFIFCSLSDDVLFFSLQNQLINFPFENTFYCTLFPVFQLICFSKWLRSCLNDWEFC